MSNLEIIEKECQFINDCLLENPTHRPMESECRLKYVMYLDPSKFGNKDEYMNGEYDDIITEYFHKLVHAFNQLEIQMGIRPAMSFTEFMGDAYQGEPMQRQEDVEFKIQNLMQNIKRIDSDRNHMPQEITDLMVERNEAALTSVMLDVKLENYAKTQEELEYINTYYSYYGLYQQLFSAWPESSDEA